MLRRTLVLNSSNILLKALLAKPDFLRSSLIMDKPTDQITFCANKESKSHICAVV